MRRIPLLLCFILLVHIASAQDSVMTMTLKQALQMGLDSSKTLKISSAKMQLAEAKYNQAVDATIPYVHLQAGYTRLSDIDEPKFLFPGASQPVALFPVYVNNYSAGLSVSETVFSGFRLKYAKESQKLLLDAAKSDSEKDKDDIAFAIVNAFFNLYKLNVSAKLIDNELAQIKERVREADLWEKNGIATKNDLLRWQLQQSNLELTKIDIENNTQIANFNFNLMLGMSGGQKIIPDSNSIGDISEKNNLNDLLSTALEKRKDLTSSDLRSRASLNALKVAQNSYLPRIALNGDFLDARPNQRYIPPVDKFNTTWSAGIGLNWDLVSLYSNKHNVDEARSLYRQSTEGQAILSDAIRSEVNQNFLLLNETRQKLDVMNKTIEQATENYRLIDSRYKNSLALISDVLDAENQLLSARVNYALTRADIQIAYYRLLKSTGSIK